MHCRMQSSTALPAYDWPACCLAGRATVNILMTREPSRLLSVHAQSCTFLMMRPSGDHSHTISLTFCCCGNRDGVPIQNWPSRAKGCPGLPQRHDQAQGQPFCGGPPSRGPKSHYNHHGPVATSWNHWSMQQLAGQASHNCRTAQVPQA